MPNITSSLKGWDTACRSHSGCVPFLVTITRGVAPGCVIPPLRGEDIQDWEPAVNEPVTRRTALKAGAALAATRGLTALGSPLTVEQPKRPAVEGYTDQLSYAPGDEVKLHVSASEPMVIAMTA